MRVSSNNLYPSCSTKPRHLAIRRHKLSEKRILVLRKSLYDWSTHGVVRQHTVRWDTNHGTHLYFGVVPRFLEQGAVVGCVKSQGVPKTLAAQL